MISILVPIYNGIEFIEESIGSILNQTFSDWEVIIGVNGHPENSTVYQIAKEYEKKSNKIRVFDFHTIKGKSNTLNEMLKYCNYDYVALLDVDDIWFPEKLMVQSKYMGEYDVIGTRCVYFGDRNNSPFIPLGDISDYDFFSMNPVINSSSVIRKSLCFWEDKFNVEDYNLWLTLRKQNKKFYNCHEVLVKHRIHSSSYFNTQGNEFKGKELINLHRNSGNK